MISEIYQQVADAIQEFRQFFRDDFPVLEIVYAYNVFDLDCDWKRGLEEGLWRQSGVYVIFDEDDKLLYVGKATATFNKRVKKQAGMTGAANCFVIPFPHQYGFFADALEAFLIRRLKPRQNHCGNPFSARGARQRLHSPSA